jgi:hypothetical protein
MGVSSPPEPRISPWMRGSRAAQRVRPSAVMADGRFLPITTLAGAAILAGTSDPPIIVASE